jgi:uncharacterized protein YciI
MLWMITRTAKPGIAKERDALRPSHLDYVFKQKNLVLGAATVSDDDTEFIGTLYIVSAADRAAAQAFLDGDPFTQAGLYTDVKIFRLRKGPWNPNVVEGTP